LTETRTIARRKVSRWWWLPDWLWQGIFILIVSWILQRVGLRIQKIGLRQLLRGVAIWVLMNPRLLGGAILAPSLLFMFTTGNEVIAHPELLWAGHWQPGQTMVLSVSGVTLGATLVASPNPKRRYSSTPW